MAMRIIKEQVERIFATRTHQADIVVDLYRLVYPDFDRIEKVNGFPSAGKELSRLIWRLAIEFDRKHHPDVMAGGCWLNHGFSTNDKLEPWEVDASHVNIIKENEAQTGDHPQRTFGVSKA